jgi:hypothetical protein
MDANERAREIAHTHTRGCTGGTGYGAGGDTTRYHSKACDALTKAIQVHACDCILATQGIKPETFEVASSNRQQ